MNKAYKQKKLSIAIKEKNMSLLAVFKHKVEQLKKHKTIMKLASQWQWLSNLNTNGVNKGMIWIMWDQLTVTQFD